MLRTALRFVLVLLPVTACGDTDQPAPPDDPLAAYTASERANPSPSRLISGLDMWGYCKAQGYPTVGYRRGYFEGDSAATDNWVCQRGTDQLKPVEPMLIDMNAACRWQNNRQDVVGRPDDPNHAWSWNCYVDTDARAGKADSAR